MFSPMVGRQKDRQKEEKKTVTHPMVRHGVKCMEQMEGSESNEWIGAGGTEGVEWMEWNGRDGRSGMERME